MTEQSSGQGVHLDCKKVRYSSLLLLKLCFVQGVIQQACSKVASSQALLVRQMGEYLAGRSCQGLGMSWASGLWWRYMPTGRFLGTQGILSVETLVPREFMCIQGQAAAEWGFCGSAFWIYVPKMAIRHLTPFVDLPPKFQTCTSVFNPCIQELP